MEKEVDLYLNNLYETDDFKRLLELKSIIDNKYSKEIIVFKTLESKYNEAKEYQKYYPNFDALKKDFINAKATLYSKIEVKEYFDLENKIANLINCDIDDLKRYISNKFVVYNNYNYNKNVTCKKSS